MQDGLQDTMHASMVCVRAGEPAVYRCPDLHCTPSTNIHCPRACCLRHQVSMLRLQLLFRWLGCYAYIRDCTTVLN
jgi:hypothetical protein